MTTVQLARSFRILFVLMLAAVTVLSLLPLKGNPVPGGDKTHHLIAWWAVVMVAVLGYTRGIGAVKRPGLSAKRLTLLVSALVVWSGVIEILQGFVGRYPEMMDLVFNSAGALAGNLCGLLLAGPVYRLLARQAEPSGPPA